MRVGRELESLKFMPSAGVICHPNFILSRLGLRTSWNEGDKPPNVSVRICTCSKFTDEEIIIEGNGGIYQNGKVGRAGGGRKREGEAGGSGKRAAAMARNHNKKPVEENPTYQKKQHPAIGTDPGIENKHE